MDIIDTFDGEYRFLSNFYSVIIEMDGKSYPSVEHAYQAAKTTDKDQRTIFASNITAGRAKRMGSKLNLRSDWNDVKINIMKSLIFYKFSKHLNLQKLLLDTGTAHLVEGNGWGDTFWGVCKGKGENHLGKILMDVRFILSL